jgi:hypothetical protein
MGIGTNQGFVFASFTSTNKYCTLITYNPSNADLEYKKTSKNLIVPKDINVRGSYTFTIKATADGGVALDFATNFMLKVVCLGVERTNVEEYVLYLTDGATS